MRRIATLLLTGAALAAGPAPAGARPATACASGYRATTLDGAPACLRRSAKCTRRAVVRHHTLRRHCLGRVLWRPQSIARR
jgi:hypothetical protein